MTTIILVLAVLSLTAGLFILFQGKASSKSGEESKDKVSIKKVVASIRKTVDEGTPVVETGVERNLLHSYRDPVEIYLDKNASDQEKDEAARILNENGYDVPRINSPENSTNSTEPSSPAGAPAEGQMPTYDCDDADVAIPDEYASDDGLEDPEDLGDD